MLDRIGWVGLGILSALGAAGVAIFGKLGLGTVPPTLATALRSLIMATIVVAAAALSGQLTTLLRGESVVGGREWLWLFLAGASGAFSWLMYFAALNLGLASKVAAVDRLSVLFVVLLSALFLNETLSPLNWLGVALLTTGIFLMAR